MSENKEAIKEKIIEILTSTEVYSRNSLLNPRQAQEKSV